MMKLEDQVVSLELAKRLKELGVEQMSHFAWFDSPPMGWVVGHVPSWSPEAYAAFTVAELGEMLRGNGMGTTAFSCMTAKWWVTGGEWIVEKQRYAHTIEDTKEADARAKMLIYLLENKLVKP